MGAHGTWKRLAKEPVPCEDPDEGLGHIVPVAVYNKVFAALLFLTALTVAAATQHFGDLSVAIALGIATVKAVLVTLYFMHLRFEKLLFWGVVAIPPIIFVLLFLGTLGDISVKHMPVPSHVEFKKALLAPGG